jgi:tetratricopeptide (TPR) repeat protein
MKVRRFVACFVVAWSSLVVQADDDPRSVPTQCTAGVDYELSLADLIAQNQHKAPDYTAARENAADCIKRYPAYAPAYAKSGQLHVRFGEWDAAIADYSKAIEVDPKDASSYRERAYGHLMKGETGEGLADANKAIELDPKDVMALSTRGDLYRRKADFQHAVADYTNAIQIASEDGLGVLESGSAHFGRGLIMMILERWPLAIDDFTKIIDFKFGDLSSAYESRAKSYEGAGKTDLAIADWDWFLAKHPRDTDALGRRAALHAKKGDTAKAVADYRALLEIDPKNEKASEAVARLAPSSAADFLKIANDKGRDNKWDEAMHAYDEAIRLDPANAEAYSGRGAAHNNRNEQDLAIADYSKAISLDPKKLKAYNGRASMYAAKGQKELALADYSFTIEHASAEENKVEAIMAYTGRGDIESGQQKTDAAMADYEKAIAIAATDSLYNYVFGPEPYIGRGRLYVAAGKLDLARADFKKALELNGKHSVAKAELEKLDPPQPAAPQTAEDFLRVAMEAGRKSDGPGAIAALQKCIELKRDFLPCHVFLGNVYTATDQFPQALTEYRLSIEIDPNHPAPYMGRGIMYAKQGRKDEAVQDLRTVLKLKPDFAEAKQALQMLGVQP